MRTLGRVFAVITAAVVSATGTLFAATGGADEAVTPPLLSLVGADGGPRAGDAGADIIVDVIPLGREGVTSEGAADASVIGGGRSPLLVVAVRDLAAVLLGIAVDRSGALVLAPAAFTAALFFTAPPPRMPADDAREVAIADRIDACARRVSPAAEGPPVALGAAPPPPTGVVAPFDARCSNIPIILEVCSSIFLRRASATGDMRIPFVQ